jgi:hypothetical protein
MLWEADQTCHVRYDRDLSHRHWRCGIRGLEAVFACPGQNDHWCGIVAEVSALRA